jgi:hypothetical protein
LRFVVHHTDAQKQDLRRYFVQYGVTREGFGQFLQRNDSHIHSVLYRTIEYGEPYIGAVSAAEPEPFEQDPGSGASELPPDAGVRSDLLSPDTHVLTVFRPGIATIHRRELP